MYGGGEGEEEEINIEIFRENKTPANINSNSNMAYFFIAIGNINNAVIEFLIYFALHMPIANRNVCSHFFLHRKINTFKMKLRY
jgi:hypothetical protein